MQTVITTLFYQHDLRLVALAEGIERLEELDFLRGETCGEAQGFLLSRPAAIGTFANITQGHETSIEGLGWAAVDPALQAS